MRFCADTGGYADMVGMDNRTGRGVEVVQAPLLWTEFARLAPDNGAEVYHCTGDPPLTGIETKGQI